MVRFSGPPQPWKNSEDAVLRAGVMKYGLNQWGRIASLFPRRTAKQCKSRWYEWLSPLIKKTEWSREEDERLVHMAKLMPTQWRTIAPLVGRTPQQCLERYDQLLEEAVGGGTGAIVAREGGVTASMETKVAKPDTVDMDEEELEMISEARARLANTLGKKAKRKAREKQQEEMKRVAAIQKRRELKAAGAGVSSSSRLGARRHRRKNSDAEEIDYVSEVPFELLAPRGPHDTREEVSESAQRAKDVEARIRSIQLATERRDAALARQRDPARSAGGDSNDHNRQTQRIETAIAEANARVAHELAAARAARPKLLVPEPTVSDAELGEVAKLAGSSKFLAPPLPPRSRRQLEPSNVAMEEARIQASRESAPNPLLGPVSSSAASGMRGGHWLSRTAILRDTLGINRAGPDDATLPAPLAKEDDAYLDDADALEARIEARIHEGFAAIPEPKFDVRVSVIDDKLTNRKDDDDDVDVHVASMQAEDAGMGEKRIAREQARNLALQAMRRPAAVRLGLPLLPSGTTAESFGDLDPSSTVSELLFRELDAILRKGAPCVDDDAWTDLCARVPGLVSPTESQAWCQTHAANQPRPAPLEEGTLRPELSAAFFSAQRAFKDFNAQAILIGQRATDKLAPPLARAKAARTQLLQARKDLQLATRKFRVESKMLEQETIAAPLQIERLKRDVESLGQVADRLQAEWRDKRMRA